MSAAHIDPVLPVLLGLSSILAAAKIGGAIADKFKQPTVLGELLAGVLIGNLIHFGFDGFEFIKHSEILKIFASVGVIILLFEVGLESNLKEMLSVGTKSLLVAIAGVALPFVLGYYASDLLIPSLSNISKIFIGATLTATSVGITARVFKDLNFLNRAEAKIVLGAAVIDDVLGLIILAIVTNMAQSGHIDIAALSIISLKSIGFVVLSLVLGNLFAKKTIHLFSYLRLPGMVLTIGLIACFMGSYIANVVGLAPIVGAFCIGMILEDIHFQNYNTDKTLEEYIKPIALFLIPIFFVMTGIEVDLSVLMNGQIVFTAVIISIIAIIGKLICGWTFSSKESINRPVIGFGMVPRGEVGLIFASVGKSIGVVDDSLYAITVIIVIITTLVSPPILSALIKSEKN